MRQVCLLVALVLIFISSYGQKSAWKKAEKLYHQFEFSAAAKEYETIVLADAGNAKAIERIALCYNKLNNPEKAEVWLAKACEQPNADPKFFKMYAQALASNGKYEEAAQWYAKHTSKGSNESSKHLAGRHNAVQNFYTDSSFYDITLLPINSKEADFSPTFYRDGIVFCSARENSRKEKHGWTNSHYIDLYLSQSQSTNVISLGAPVNSPLHEGPAALSKNYDTLFFTRNNYVNNKKATSAEGIVKLKIFFSVWKNGAWSKEQGMSINHDEYSSGHPALSPDHKLYFASDMPGGYGGTDLYFTKFEKGIWIAPVNLGSAINTSENEMFPFIDQNGNLYFASTGHSGLGGLDIFHAASKNGALTEPRNIGYPINTSKDDFGFITKNGRGYFSSNRGVDHRDDNIYSFTIDYTKTINIQATDESGKALENFSIALSSDPSAALIDVEKIYTGQFNCLQHYSIQCLKTGYKQSSLPLMSEQLKELPTGHTVQIKMIRSVKNIQIILQSLGGDKLPGGTISVKNLTTGQIEKIATDANGSIVIKFQAGQQYQLTGSHPKFKNKTIDINNIDSLSEGTTIPVSLQSSEELFEKNEVGELIELDIRYDVAKATIRKDAALELDKLVVFLKKYPTVKVELGSHSDSRGSSEANLLLSQKRAESAVRYIVIKKISSQRLIPIGYGEDDPKIKDAETDDEHQRNRRTTVKITGI
ncbi:MAG: OmpA family protein [Chryseolinea sp.]